MAPDGTADEPLDFTGRSVVVTGGSRGLGRTIATTFLDAGADVLICARSDPLEPVTSTDGVREAAFVAADVRAADQVANVVAVALKRSGHIDVL
ncbi:MAG TPA: short-chain dehydrogenase, partial [Acidimicrobiaceae bacterium]|nr:short-chain dehydrogenase [Acidimicrobiaceae bacterium]